MPKGKQTRAKKSLFCTPKKYYLKCKKNIFTEKIAISKYSHTLGIILSFWHTLSTFSTLSQRLAALLMS